MTFQEIQHDSVLKAKLRIACVAEKNYQKELHGEPVDDCCIQKVLFTYGLILDVECYDLDSEDDNCYDFDDFLKATQLLDSMLI